VDTNNIKIQNNGTPSAKRKRCEMSASPSIGTPPSTPVIKSTPGKRRSGERSGSKAGKGLRHFSLKVCRKVEEKMETSYNEVGVCTPLHKVYFLIFCRLQMN
jgi:hypothetical protein